MSHLPQSYVHAAEAAKKSDDDAKKSQESAYMKSVQDPHSYTAAEDAARKSDADALKDQRSQTPASHKERLVQTGAKVYTGKTVWAAP